MQSALDVEAPQLLFDDAQKTADLFGKGYTLQPFLDAADVKALHRLHAQTLPAVRMPNRDGFVKFSQGK